MRLAARRPPFGEWASKCWSCRMELAGLSLAWILIWITVWGVADANYRFEVARAYRETSRSAEKLASTTVHTLDQIGLTAALVKHLFERDGRVDLGALAGAELLGDRNSLVVSLADADGKVFASTLPFGDVSFADRGYFARARAQTTVLAVDPPVFGRISGKWVIPAARALHRRDGTFAGIVLVAFASEMLTGDFQHDDGAETLVAVVGDDGIFRSRRVGSIQSSGDRVALSRLLQGPSSTASTDRYQPAVSPVDHVARFPTSVPIPGTNLRSLVAVSAEKTLAAYRTLRNGLVIGGVVVSAVALLVVLVFSRQARKGRIATRAKRDNEIRQRAILDSIPAQVVLVDAFGTITSSNEGWHSYVATRDGGDPSNRLGGAYGATRAEVYGGSAAASKDILDGIQAVLAGSVERHSTEHEGLNGRWFRVNATPAFVGEERNAVVTHVDITDRRSEKADVLRNQALHQMVCRVAKIGGSSFDVRTNTLTLSDNLRSIYELEPGQTLTVEERHALNTPGDRPRMQAAFERCVSEGIAYDIEVQMRTVTGRVFWARAIGEPVRNAAGAVVEVHSALQDNTERKRIEIAAEQAATNLDVALESMTDAFCMLDADWRFTYVNRETEWLLRKSRDELLGTTFWSAFPELAGTPLEGRLRASINKSGATQCEEFLTPVGAWCEATVYPSDTGVAVYLRDMTEQRRAHQQLRLLETCVARMNDMVVVTEATPLEQPGPRIVFVNDAFVACSGFSREELIGNTPRLLQGPNTQRDELDRIASSLRALQPVRAELVNYTKAGREYWVEIDVVPVRDEVGAVTHFLSVERDITQRRLDQAALRHLNHQLEDKVEARTSELASAHTALMEREEETRSVLENMADGVVCLDGDGLVRSANSMLFRLLGYAPQELFGKSLAALLPNASLTDGNEECLGVHKSGEPIALDVAFSSFDVKGKRMYTAILRDIRERQQVLYDLKRAQAAAEDASRAKSAFVATMSHEIRTPMNGVIGMIDILRGTPLEGEQREMLTLAHESALALLDIVESILDFSKIEAGKVEVEKAPISLLEVVEGVFGLGQSIADKQRVRLSLYIDPAIPYRVLGDAVKVRQTLLNIVSNAVKFSSGGGRRGEVSLRAAVRDLGPDNATVRFSVEDNGIGMDAATVSRLFRPFSQADASTTRRFGGTGLGLSIVQALVDLMGGKVLVESEPGKGSRLVVDIPFDLVPHERSAGTLAGSHCVLLTRSGRRAEDLRSYLHHTECCYELVDNEASAVAALAAAQSARLTCVVALEDGVDVAERIQAELATRMTPRVGYVVLTEGGGRAPYRQFEDFVIVTADGLTADLLTLALSAALREKELRRTPASHRDEVVTEQQDDLLARDVRPILIAEDNEINQKVIATQLARLGYPVRLVDNGADALELFKCGEFSMVLTDLRMPKMDGFGLAAAIRSAELPGRRIPIVALTANALKEEKERCLVVGIDAYATKPIGMKALQALLEKWISRNVVQGPGDQPDVPREPGATEQCLDVGVLEELVGDDPAVIAELLARFETSLVDGITLLNASADALDWKSVSDHAHRLKAAALSCGATTLGRIFAELEDLAIQEEPHAGIHLLNEMNCAFREVMKSIVKVRFRSSDVGHRVETPL